MKKNGFVFAETIIVLSVVLVGLIMLYSIFSGVVRREKVAASYNQTIDIYHLYEVKTYLQAISASYAAGTIVPRGTGPIANINTGVNSQYFRLECQCHDLVNEAYRNKYNVPYNFCEDLYDPLYFNYCSVLNNHLNITEVYVIKNNNISGAIEQIIADEKLMVETCSLPSGGSDTCHVMVAGKRFDTPRFSGNVRGIPRRVNASLIDYLKTLSPIQSTIEGEDWSNDYIIIAEFYYDGRYSYASLRYEG